MTEETNIYKLNLHETIEIDSYRVTRVPGGWLYFNRESTYEGNMSTTSTFVPLNFEFQEVTEK